MTVRESVGVAFHEELDRVIPDVHEPHAAHNDAVGAALLRSLSGDPDGAVAQYNAWAETAGFAPVSYVGVTAEGEHLVDMPAPDHTRTVRVRIDAEGHVCGTVPRYETRILPPEEWPRLVGTEAETVWPSFDPKLTTVVVVERDGVIVGCHVLAWVLHAECLWADPTLPSHTSVARRLWPAVKQIAGAQASRVMTAAIDDRVRALLAHVGAVRVPGEHYMVSVREGGS